MLDKNQRATINFEKMIAEVKNDDGTIKQIPVRRTEKNKRERPNANLRQSTGIEKRYDDKLKLLNSKDLEWLAWNWRLVYNQKMFTTKK